MFSSFVAKRLQGFGLPLNKILPEITQLLSEWQSTPPLCYAGSPPIQIELNEAGIASYMEWLNSANAMSIPKPFILSSHDYNPILTLFINSSEFDRIESIKFHLSSESSAKALQLNSFVNLVIQICNNFGAYQGYVCDDLLAGLHQRNIRIFEQQLAQTPPDMRKFIPRRSLVEGVVDILPPLLLEYEFDNRRVPNGIWWVNFWDRTQVETVGILQIKSAPWALIVELPEGAMVLAATEDPTNTKNPLHLAKLSEIVEHLHLMEVQKRYVI